MSEQTYQTSSGLGGTFTVVIEEEEGDLVKVRCTNPGWQTYSFWIRRDQLIEDGPTTHYSDEAFDPNKVL